MHPNHTLHDDAETRFRQGCALIARQDYTGALRHLRASTRLAPGERRYLKALILALGHLPPAPADEAFDDELRRWFADDRVDPNRLRHVVSQQVLHKPGIRRLLSDAARPPTD